ncbi:hypothetical protein Y032_0191g1310 [Ancylostoma ceylanicum]|uniref:RH1 domain-containing protein n=2 Tax=Ancylostoma ceylanicum TaxID=53326 RepID=A0A016SQN6_9BILA|nr:hypothetical protein Y032_0191g1310 [Ancylostoma ceylanicum]
MTTPFYEIMELSILSILQLLSDEVEIFSNSQTESGLIRMSALQSINEVQDSPGSGSPSEVVYGGTVSPTGDEHRNMSEKVQNMASAIYREFELMIQRYGEDGVKTLMPLVVNVLEALDLAFLEREEQAVDQEMLKEDNEQLVTQYEREKQLRKQAEQKYMEIEDHLIGQNKELEAKIESLESIMRMLELKAKNASDHAARLEEREADQKAEFDRLHERYNALLRTHVDHMERTKYLMGNDKFELMQNMPLPQAQLRTRMGMAASVDASSIRGVSDLISAHMSQSTTMDVNLANHISNEADWQDEFSSDVEPSPRDAASEEEKTAPSSGVENAARDKKESEREEEEAEEQQDGEDSLGADLTDVRCISYEAVHVAANAFVFFLQGISLIRRSLHLRVTVAFFPCRCMIHNLDVV